MAVDPDRHAFEADIMSADFTAGVDRGHWRRMKASWPHVLIVVCGGDEEVALRFDLNGYPGAAPTACPWNVETDQPLAPERWPRGARVSEVFRPEWNQNALYFPLDRVALEGHDAWLALQQTVVWTPGCNITAYLRFIRDLLIEKEAGDAAQAA